MVDVVAVVITAVAILAVAIVYFIKSRPQKPPPPAKTTPNPAPETQKREKKQEKQRKQQPQKPRGPQPLATAERVINLGNTTPLCISFENGNDYFVVCCRNRQQILYSVSAFESGTTTCHQRYTNMIDDTVIDSDFIRTPSGEYELVLGLDRLRAVHSFILDPNSSKFRQGNVDISSAAKQTVDKVRIAPDASFITTLGDDTHVRVFHPNGTLIFGRETGQMRNTELTVSSNSEFITVGAFSKALVVYGVQRDRAGAPTKVVKAFTLSGHTNSVETVDFDSKSLRVATGGKDKRYNVAMSPERWNEGDDIPKPLWAGEVSEPIKIIRISPGGDTLAILLENGELLFVRKEGVVKKVEVAHQQTPSDVQWTRDGKWVVVISTSSQFIYGYTNP